eukprot:1184982-Prorocentrum_minimum.AAC.3
MRAILDAIDTCRRMSHPSDRLRFGRQIGITKFTSRSCGSFDHSHPNASRGQEDYYMRVLSLGLISVTPSPSR